MLNVFLKAGKSVVAWKDEVDEFWPFGEAEACAGTFLNHYSLDVSTEKGVMLDRFDYIFVDGAALAKQLSGKLGMRIPRVSFDLSSVALPWIQRALSRGYKVIFVGGKKDEAIEFRRWVFSNVPRDYENSVAVYDGFSGITAGNLYETLENHGKYFVVFGLGTPLQENMALELSGLFKNNGQIAVVLTCGGFITQTAQSRGDFYPRIVDQLGIRWLWRCYKQPYVIRRIVSVYPRSFLKVFKSVSVDGARSRER